MLTSIFLAMKVSFKIVFEELRINKQTLSCPFLVELKQNKQTKQNFIDHKYK